MRRRAEAGVVSYEEAVGVVLTWSGEAALKPQYPFDTDVKDYFSLLYNTDFWKDAASRPLILSLIPAAQAQNTSPLLRRSLRS